MGQRGSLSQFQTYLAKRLAGAGSQPAAGLLGVLSGEERWLLPLQDSGEVVPPPPLTTVPLTRPWFAGIANIRGDLYAVTDFAAFCGKEAAPRSGSARLLLVGPRQGNNCALLVDRMLGLHNIADLTPTDAGMPSHAWAGQAFADKDGCTWRMLDVRHLMADENFMSVGL